MIAIDLSDRVALVTGASGQLGRAMARTLAGCGADVIVHYHKNAKQAQKLVGEIVALGRRAAAIQADITDAKSVQAMAKSATKQLRSPDIVVANALIQYSWKTVLDQPPADFESQFRSCVAQNVLLAQAFVPEMIARKFGRVIGINTECTMQCAPGQGAYVSGKRGMDGLLRVLAREVGPHGITVNQVAPGWTISEDNPDTDAAKPYRDMVPLGRRGTADDIANAVAFLASDLAAFITGVYLPVCGGNVMPCV